MKDVCRKMKDTPRRRQGKDFGIDPLEGILRNPDKLEEVKTNVALALAVAISIWVLEKHCTGEHPDEKSALTLQTFFPPSLQN